MFVAITPNLHGGLEIFRIIILSLSPIIIYLLKPFSSKKLNLYLVDNFKLSIKHKLSGIIISSNNKRNLYYGNPLCKKIKFQIYGKAHNQVEYYFKNRQNCIGIFCLVLMEKNTPT